MGWGINKTLSNRDQEIEILVRYEGGEKLIMSAVDYMSSGYEPTVEQLPWSISTID